MATLDIIKDNVTGNQYSRDTSVQGSTYAPYQGSTLLPKVDPTAPIEAAKLNAAPLQTPAPVQSNIAQDTLASHVGSAADTAYTSQQQAATDAAQTPPAPVQKNALQTVLDKILTDSTALGQKGPRSLEIQNEEGVATKKKAQTDLDNQILSTTRAYDKQIQAVKDKNPTGQYESGQDIRISQLERQKNSELADLAIQQKVAQSNYQGAFEIAQAKVNAEFEPLQNEIDTLKTYYQLSQNDMTESEKQQAQAAIEDKRIQLQTGQQMMLEQYKLKIQQADPLYQAQVRTANANADLSSANANFLSGMTGGGTTPGTSGTSTDLSNNPGAIKLGPATQKWVDQGLATVSPTTAADGGHFLVFKDLASGIAAQKDLFFNSGVYSNLTVSAALNKWSNGGYSGNIAPDVANKLVKDLTPAEQNYLVTSQMQREGTSSPSAYSQSLTGSNGFPGDPTKSPGSTLLNYAVQQGHLDPTALNASKGNVAKLATYVNVLRTNPEYNFINLAANAAATKSSAIAQGKQSTNLQLAGNTVIQHLPQVAEDLKSLTRTGSPLINGIMNTVGSATSQSTQKYLSDLSVLRGEVAKILVGNGVSTDQARTEAGQILPSTLNYDGFMKLVGDTKSGTGLLNLMQEKINQYGQPVNLTKQPTTRSSFKPL